MRRGGGKGLLKRALITVKQNLREGYDPRNEKLKGELDERETSCEDNLKEQATLLNRSSPIINKGSRLTCIVAVADPIPTSLFFHNNLLMTLAPDFSP